MDNKLPIITLEILPLEGGGFKAEVCTPTLTKVKDGVWIVHSPFFGTVGYSTTSETEAEADHDEDVKTFLGINLRQGTLASALTRLGWQVRLVNGASFYERSQDIPVQLLQHTRVTRNNYELCHA